MYWVLVAVALAGLLPEGTACPLPAPRREALPTQPETTPPGGQGFRALWERILEIRSQFSIPMLFNVYRPDPNVRQEQLLFESENLRQIHDEVRRFWMNDQPAHGIHQQIHG